MLLAICGMPRSGSTFSFNIARELLERRGSVYFEPTEDIERVVATSATDNVIIKNHNLNHAGISLLKAGRMKGICTVREPLSAIESLMDIFGFDIDQSILAFQLWIDSFNQFHEYVLVLPYVSIEQKPLRTILRIARYLGVTPSLGELLSLRKKYSRQQVMKMSNNMSQSVGATTDLGYTFYDNQNFFHRRHVRQAKNVTLTPEQSDYIRSHLQRLDCALSYV
jgi:hypothetical protein